MNAFAPHDLIHGYLDETLTAAQQQELADWIQSDPRHAQEFAHWLRLHDSLSRAAALHLEVEEPPARPRARVLTLRSRRWLSTVAVTLGLALVVGGVGWQQFGPRSVTAAVVELDRLIAVHSRSLDCTYALTVEASTRPPRRPPPVADPHATRPPKLPLDGARLYVRDARRFVLERPSPTGSPSITGSNGHVSWSVSPEGRVRVSSDVRHFQRDVPGHEHDLPLHSLPEGLEHLRDAYDITLLPAVEADTGDSAGDSASDSADASARVSTGESGAAQEGEPERLLVAVKKRGQRGPARVEVAYGATSGRIRQVRFVGMPYGPDRLTVCLTLVEERPLGVTFFDPESHAGPDAQVEWED